MSTSLVPDFGSVQPRLAVHSEETAELAPALCSSVEETLYAQATQFSLKRRPEEADGYPHAPWRGTVECRSEEAPREGTHKPMRDHRSCGRGRLAQFWGKTLRLYIKPL